MIGVLFDGPIMRSANNPDADRQALAMVFRRTLDSILG